MSDHAHGSSRQTLLIAFVLTSVFAIVEALAGWLSNSLALIGDAGHMVTDSLSLALGALAAWISQRPPSLRHSFGLKRAEAVGAMFNIAFMLVVITYIAVEAVDRLENPEPVQGELVILVALIGLFINIGVAWVLHRGEQNLNVKGAMLHVMGDLLGSVAALVAGTVIWLTAWYPIDPILSLLIAVLILISSLRLFADVLHVMMEGVPADIDLENLGRTLATVPGVKHIHDLHVWALDSNTYAVSAHAVVANLRDWEPVRKRLEARLSEGYGIRHSTLQPEDSATFEEECANGSCGDIFAAPSEEAGKGAQ